MSQERCQKTQKRSKSQDVTGAPNHGTATKGESNDDKKAPPPTANITSSTNATDLFQLLGDDVHAHILSYRMCLREGRVQPAITALQLYRDANRDECTRTHPESSFYDITVILNERFESLDESEKEPWHELARPDQERHAREQAAIVRPNDLFGIMNGLALVSKQWFNVVGQVMNAQAAPIDILSSRDLFQLKCRALVSLDLSSVGRKFLQLMRREWGRKYIEYYNAYDYTTTTHNVVDIILAGYGTSFAHHVAAEYVKFLVVKCVETLAANKSNKQWSSSCASEETMGIWREKCEVTNLLQLFWRAHMENKEKYAADCQMLIGELMPNKQDTSDENKSSSLIEYDTEYSCPWGGCDYMSKRNTLFRFEKQVPPRNFFFGRFGDDLNKKRLLLSQEFDVHAVARGVLEERKSQQRIQLERAFHDDDRQSDDDEANFRAVDW